MSLSRIYLQKYCNICFRSELKVFSVKNIFSLVIGEPINHIQLITCDRKHSYISNYPRIVCETSGVVGGSIFTFI